jgi:tetratricopeptide (TPR) repeat protein
LVTEDPALFEQLAPREEERMRTLKSLDSNSPYYLFLQAEVQLQWAMVKLKFGKRLAAVDSGVGAYKMLKQNEANFPDFIPHRKTLGACKVLLGSLPKQSRKWAGLFGLKGDIKEGLADLESAIQADTPFRLEAQVIKGFVLSYVLGNHDEAMALFQSLSKRHPDNQLLYFAVAVAAKHAGKASFALGILEQAPKGDSYGPFHFLDYLKAEASLLTGDYYKSIMYGKAFLQRYKGKNYVKDAYFKLFLAHWFINDPHAKQYLEKVKTEGQIVVVPDQYAERFAADGELPHKGIMQARLLHDGGQYAKALQLLAKIDPEALPSLRDQIEHYYRRARSLQLQGSHAEAVATYKQVIAICPKSYPYYFGGNAALQLGIIYWEVYHDRKSAEYYFHQVPTYEGHEYEGSLNQRAKALLEVME